MSVEDEAVKAALEKERIELLEDRTEILAEVSDLKQELMSVDLTNKERNELNSKIKNLNCELTEINSRLNLNKKKTTPTYDEKVGKEFTHVFTEVAKEELEYDVYMKIKSIAMERIRLRR